VEENDVVRSHRLDQLRGVIAKRVVVNGMLSLAERPPISRRAV
jgi:hypothetical protein